MSKKSKTKKRKRIVWAPEPEKSNYQHPHLIPKKPDDEILIHTKFKK